MKPFPHVLIRVSGGDFEQLESLNLKESLQPINDIRQLKEKLGEVKQDLSQQLYDMIPQIKDARLQNMLLNIRRDVFNERDIPADTLNEITSHLPDPLNEDLKNYLKIKDTINKLSDQGEETFSREVLRLRKNLHTLAADETLQKGLVLSSQSLLKRIPGYLSKECPTQKKDFQTERGLIKYISRMYAKTSPFSTFTNLVMAKPAPAPTVESTPKRTFLWLKDEKNKKPTITCHIRLNNLLYKYLQVLLYKNPGIYRHLLVRPNPTLKQGEKNYLFLTNHDNIEAFQRIPFNPVVELFRQLTAREKEGISIHELVKTIVDNERIDAPAEDIEAYVIQLLEYGFLEYNIGISGVDPDWDIKLREVLVHINSGDTHIPLVSELADTLKNLRTLAGQYGETPFHKRNSILEEAFRQFRAICMKLHQAAGLLEEERISPEDDEIKRKFLRGVQGAPRRGEPIRDGFVTKDVFDNSTRNCNLHLSSLAEKSPPGRNSTAEVFKHQPVTYFYFKPEQVFYEDTTLDIAPRVDDVLLGEFIDALHDLLQNMRRFEGLRDEQDKMRFFFVHKYGNDASIDLMTFYEEFYCEFKKPEAELQKKQEQMQQQEKDEDKSEGPPEVPEIKERQETNRAWIEKFKANLKKEITGIPDVIRLYRHQIERTHREFAEGISSPDTGCSYGSFVQFYLENGVDEGDGSSGKERLIGVLNSSFPGFGKLFSRFLHVFDDRITNDIRQWNEWLSNEALLLEDCDASYFNANLHPPLLPYEVRIPGGHNSLPPGKQIPITDLEVRLEEKGDRLQLVHKPTQKRVYVFDLGFQGHQGRSQLFQLLEKFTMAEYLFPQPLVHAAANIGEEGPGKKEKEEGKTHAAVRVNPRIVYDDRIVLRRKTWYIPVEKLPFKEPGESQWAYFLRVNEWRRELGVPEEVFVHVLEDFGRQPGQSRAQQKPGRDDYKPQYISFNNPFLMDLFEKLIKRVPYSLKVVEMLPNSRQLLRIGNSKHITEFTLQWYTYGPAHHLGCGQEKGERQ
ncbi:MAG: lantibiotic dehydratase [Candidatus Aminicenantes bacterium]|nr:MAG: lantibiotic dehydratase [Candidatus Aminicenantes bacterium]